jgi:hypothetical protein
MSDVDLLAARLEAELGDAVIARELAHIVEADALSWTAPAIAPRRIQTIIGFTFGNRMAPNGNRTPGPVNEALAKIVVRLHGETGAPVIAQWEVAEAAVARLPEGVVTPIYPGQDDRGEPAYLSTLGVLEKIAQRFPPVTLGTVGVVAFSDHIGRSVATARRLGFDAHAPQGHAMPVEYDALSGQAWCRSRLHYLLHDMMLRVTERRAAMLACLPPASHP